MQSLVPKTKTKKENREKRRLRAPPGCTRFLYKCKMLPSSSSQKFISLLGIAQRVASSHFIFHADVISLPPTAIPLSAPSLGVLTGFIVLSSYSYSVFSLHQLQTYIQLHFNSDSPSIPDTTAASTGPAPINCARISSTRSNFYLKIFLSSGDFILFFNVMLHSPSLLFVIIMHLHVLVLCTKIFCRA